jgi:polysaccharide pyruvyl transferase WcaK-like protein
MDSLLSEPTVAFQETRATVLPAKKIGLLDHLGFGNLGDDATLDAVMSNLRARWPHAEVIALTMNPLDTRHRHGVPAYAIRRVWKMPHHAQLATPRNRGFKAKVKRWVTKYPALYVVLSTIKKTAVEMPKKFFHEIAFLAESFSIVKELDLLVISGGGQLLDSWGGPWAFPYTLFKWVFLAKFARVRCYFVNVGAGPLNKPLSKWFVTRSLSVAEYVSFRDDDSRALVEQIGFKGKSEVSVDCVYGLDLSAHNTTDLPARKETVVGFSPMAYCDPRAYWDQNQSVYEHYIQRLVSFGAWLISQQHLIKIFSTEISFDQHAIEDLTRALKNHVGAAASPYITLEPVHAFPGLITAIRGSEYIVTCRYHGVVLAHLMNRPVLAISHHPKIATLMHDLELSEYCVDIRAFDPELLTDKFTRLVENRGEIKARMSDKARRYNRELKAQFDRLFPRQTAAEM